MPFTSERRAKNRRTVCETMFQMNYAKIYLVLSDFLVANFANKTMPYDTYWFLNSYYCRNFIKTQRVALCKFCFSDEISLFWPQWQSFALLQKTRSCSCKLKIYDRSVLFTFWHRLKTVGNIIYSMDKYVRVYGVGLDTKSKLISVWSADNTTPPFLVLSNSQRDGISRR